MECYVMPMVLDLLTIFQDVQAAQLVASWLAASWLLGGELDGREMTVNLSYICCLNRSPKQFTSV